jgi:hypothetical protein
MCSARYLVLIVILICSCAKTVDDNDLSFNQKKWSNLKIANYEFTLTVSCYCLPERIGPHIIKVADDKIVSVNNLPYNISKTGELVTFNQLFGYIQTSIDKNPFSKTIQYNSIYGYPETVYFDFDQRIADEEIGYQITNLKIN